MLSARWDVIIVGARIAGATLAAYLGMAGLRVLVLDRAAFPNDLPQQASWDRDTNHRWAKIGFLSAVEGLGAPRICGFDEVTEHTVVSYTYPMIDSLTYGMFVRRRPLDQLLVSLATAIPGVEVRTGQTVTELMAATDGRVTGVRSSWRGQTGEERATLVVGADGRHSTVAGLVSAQAYNYVPSPKAFYFTTYGATSANTERFPHHLAMVHIGRDWNLSAPVDAGLLMVGVSLNKDELSSFRAGLPDSFEERVRCSQYMRERIGSGTREGRIYGATDLDMRMRVPFGPGWALVGDAGLHLDPIAGLGTGVAVASCEFLSEAIVAGLGGRTPLEQALAGYHEQRDRYVAESYRATAERLEAGEPSPKERTRARILAADPALRELRMRSIFRLDPPEVFAEAFRAAVDARRKAKATQRQQS